MAPKVELLAKKYMRCPVQVTIGSSTSSTSNVDITQIINMVKESQKPAMLAKVAVSSRWHVDHSQQRDAGHRLLQPEGDGRSRDAGAAGFAPSLCGAELGHLA